MKTKTLMMRYMKPKEIQPINGTCHKDYVEREIDWEAILNDIDEMIRGLNHQVLKDSMWTREYSLARTKLQEARFWLGKAVEALDPFKDKLWAPLEPADEPRF